MMSGGGMMAFSSGSMPAMPTNNTSTTSASEGNVSITQNISGGGSNLDAKELAKVAQRAVTAELIRQKTVAGGMLRN